jgi:hypothetical protein
MPAAQDTIRDIFNRNVGNRNLVYEFNLFDASVRQKLWSTRYYLRDLLNVDINSFVVVPPTSSTASGGLTVPTYPMLDAPRFCLEVNRLLDGFFMNSMSTLDTLGHQIYTIYSCASIPTRIYIHTARDMLLAEHPACKLGSFLNRRLSMRWFLEFEPFRHCTTHESLIRYDDIGIKFDHITLRYQLSRQVKLPDNPQVRPFTYNRNRVASKYCQSLFQRVAELLDQAYENILLDVQKNGNVLPIP